MPKKGPSPASVVAIHPRHDLKYDVLFAVRNTTVRVRLPRRLGNKFLKYNTVGSTGVLTWRRKRLVDWRPVPVERPARPRFVHGSPFQAKVVPVPGTVFISYPSAAADDANWVASAFEAAGGTVWIDETAIKPAQSLPDSIESGIEQADIFVPLVDVAWLASHWCIRELQIARRSGTRVAPMQIDHKKLRLRRAVQEALDGVGDPLILNLRRADANEQIIALAQRLLTEARKQE